MKKLTNQISAPEWDLMKVLLGLKSVISFYIYEVCLYTSPPLERDGGQAFSQRAILSFLKNHLILLGKHSYPFCLCVTDVQAWKRSPILFQRRTVIEQSPQSGSVL